MIEEILDPEPLAIGYAAEPEHVYVAGFTLEQVLLLCGAVLPLIFGLGWLYFQDDTDKLSGNKRQQLMVFTSFLVQGLIFSVWFMVVHPQYALAFHLVWWVTAILIVWLFKNERARQTQIQGESTTT